MNISLQLKKECVPDSVNWNRALEASQHVDSHKETFDVGSNVLGMNFEAEFKTIYGRRACILTPVYRTYEGGKLVSEQRFTHMRKARWLQRRPV